MFRWATFLFVLLAPAAAWAGSYDDFNAGVAATNREEWDLASSLLTGAIASGDLPANLVPVAYYDLAQGCAAKHQPQKAIDYLSKAIAIQPDDVLSHLFRAALYNSAGQYDASIADYSAVIQLRPSYIDALLFRANVRLNATHFDEANVDLASFLKMSPNDAGAVFLEGLVYWAMARYPEAVAEFDAGLKISPKDGYAILWREIARLRAGDTNSKLSDQADEIDKERWPGVLVKLFLGKSSPDAVLQATGMGAVDEVAGQKCEAEFFVAEWTLLVQKADAHAALLTASRDCAQNNPWTVATDVELRRTSPSPAP
jgi:tetratricopeptide (TPR) repeat protein